MLFKIPQDRISDVFSRETTCVVWFKNPKNDTNKLIRKLCQRYSTSFFGIIGVQMNFYSRERFQLFNGIRDYRWILLYKNLNIIESICTPNESQIISIFEHCIMENNNSNFYNFQDV